MLNYTKFTFITWISFYSKPNRSYLKNYSRHWL